MKYLLTLLLAVSLNADALVNTTCIRYLYAASDAEERIDELHQMGEASGMDLTKQIDVYQSRYIYYTDMYNRCTERNDHE